MFVCRCIGKVVPDVIFDHIFCSLANTCITQLSAGSSTVPGGYEDKCQQDYGEQFPVCDDRSPADVDEWLRTNSALRATYEHILKRECEAFEYYFDAEPLMRLYDEGRMSFLTLSTFVGIKQWFETAS